jgi:hypothetical protein
VKELKEYLLGRKSILVKTGKMVEILDSFSLGLNDNNLKV